MPWTGANIRPPISSRHDPRSLTRIVEPKAGWRRAVRDIADVVTASLMAGGMASAH
jgi:hypothetical protein